MSSSEKNYSTWMKKAFTAEFIIIILLLFLLLFFGARNRAGGFKRSWVNGRRLIAKITLINRRERKYKVRSRADPRGRSAIAIRPIFGGNGSERIFPSYLKVPGTLRGCRRWAQGAPARGAPWEIPEGRPPRPEVGIPLPPPLRLPCPLNWPGPGLSETDYVLLSEGISYPLGHLRNRLS